jgi:hypothetical protein
MTNHDAEIVIEPKVPGITIEEVCRSEGTIDEEVMRDPRWPTHCKCGYKFHPEEHWQHNVKRLYEGSPDGKLYILRNLPIGAMWDAYWLKDATPDRYTGPDGKAWCVMLPGGMEWIVYGPASDTGEKWDVQGVPPLITVHPSINNVGVFHGHIKNGIISEA